MKKIIFLLISSIITLNIAADVKFDYENIKTYTESWYERITNYPSSRVPEINFAYEHVSATNRLFQEQDTISTFQDFYAENDNAFLSYIKSNYVLETEYKTTSDASSYGSRHEKTHMRFKNTHESQLLIIEDLREITSDKTLVWLELDTRDQGLVFCHFTGSDVKKGMTLPNTKYCTPAPY